MRRFCRWTGRYSSDAERYPRQLVVEPHNGPDGSCARCGGSGQYTSYRYDAGWGKERPSKERPSKDWCSWCRGTGVVGEKQVG